MARQKRADMIASTRSKLIAAGRKAFAEKGYAETAMEDLTADAELTRGALYHHFGGKKGLLEAVIAQIDEESSARLRAVVETADTPWEGFVEECVEWIKLALEPEIQRIVLLDGPAVLGDPARAASRSACLASTMHSIQVLIDHNVIKPVDAQATAYLVNGAALNASLWIASAADPHLASTQAIASFRILLSGLLR
ncbi:MULTISPECIES: TetR/AcrR family transcriptional regulator [Pseudomonas fluorescens group]|uniref:TetC_1 protein n=1 Tax=Pseudomonas fluorescens TaxID=294 RepID=A0A0D0THW1_PSEFL|nr:MULTISPECIES: TetR/AcrR family transcriptional regulator [Pseudomonas fluorescens group]AZE61414.1 Transcriptional regulator, AcrR family [Pseudomonas synxantha]KIR22981.1 Transposon Tn10 TetC protein [Pseudomonas fluorescens]